MTSELIVFIVYLAVVMGIGLYFFFKTKTGGEKEYFLGGRQMSGPIAALSAGASDMSSWVLMGLPASVYLYGVGKIWIGVGLAIGTILSWALVASRLRKFSIVSNDSITVPQYLTNRFLSRSRVLQAICAVIFLVVYAIYAASSIKACGTLFNSVLGVDITLAMLISAAVIIVYTFLGGYSAVCWTDFFQGMLMLIALMLVPIVILFTKNVSAAYAATELPAGYFRFFPNGLDWKGVSDILSGFGWGLGYFGMPHIIIRYMSIKSPAELKKSRIIGSVWTALILLFAVLGIGILGRVVMPGVEDSSRIFIEMVRSVFPGVVSGILLSAILAASMSTADSQLLASASAFSSDVYKPLIRKNASDKEMMAVGRIIVAAVSIAALLIALNPNSGSIMDLVENAWGLFGASFGPAILISLYNRKCTFAATVAGIVTGAAVDVLWLIFFSSTGLYEIIPGFIAGIIAMLIVIAIKPATAEVTDLYDRAKAYDK